MKITRAAASLEGLTLTRPETTAVPRFEGVVKQVPIGEQDGMAFSVVHFYDGARTFPHHHGGGQILIVLSGRGQVGSDGGDAQDILPGDVVHADPGESHWHGAAPGHDMTHVSIAIGASVWPGEAPPAR